MKVAEDSAQIPRGVVTDPPYAQAPASGRVGSGRVGSGSHPTVDPSPYLPSQQTPTSSLSPNQQRLDALYRDEAEDADLLFRTSDRMRRRRVKIDELRARGAI